MSKYRSTWKSVAAAAAAASLIAACGGSDDASTATTAAGGGSATTAPATTAAGGGGSTSVPAPPAGSQLLQEANENGATYWRYSINGQTPQQVVATYQSELTAAGFAVTNSGGGGGGWGKWGGANAGVSADKDGEYIDVQAGGQSSGPTYFEVCAGPSEQSVEDCENSSQGPGEQNQNQDQNQNNDSNSGGS